LTGVLLAPAVVPVEQYKKGVDINDVHPFWFDASAVV